MLSQQFLSLNLALVVGGGFDFGSVGSQRRRVSYALPPGQAGNKQDCSSPSRLSGRRGSAITLSEIILSGFNVKTAA